MKEQEMQAWFLDFSAYFSPFNKPMTTSFPIGENLLQMVRIFDQETKTYVCPFPDRIVNPTDPNASPEARKHAVEVLYNAAKKEQLVIPSETGPQMVGIGEDGGPTAKPLNRENVSAKYPGMSGGPVKKWFKGLIHRIFPKAFKEDFERERIREEAMQACDPVINDRHLSIHHSEKEFETRRTASDLMDFFMSMKTTPSSVGYTLASCVENMSKHDSKEMELGEKIRVNFALYSAAYVLRNASREDAKLFLTGDKRLYSQSLRDLITESHTKFQECRNNVFAENKNADYSFRDPNASLEAIKVITDIMIKEPELSQSHVFAGTLSKIFAGIVRYDQENAAPSDRIPIKASDKIALNFASGTLPTMGDIYYQSVAAESETLRTGQIKEEHPEYFTSIIAKDVINSILAENQAVLSSVPPEKSGSIPVKKLSSSMQAMLTDMFTKDNMYSLLAECSDVILKKKPDVLDVQDLRNVMGAHIVSSPEEKRRIGNIYLREGQKLVFEKLAKQPGSSVEIDPNVVVAGKYKAKGNKADTPETGTPEEGAVVKYKPDQWSMGRF